MNGSGAPGEGAPDPGSARPRRRLQLVILAVALVVGVAWVVSLAGPPLSHTLTAPSPASTSTTTPTSAPSTGATVGTSPTQQPGSAQSVIANGRIVAFGSLGPGDLLTVFKSCDVLVQGCRYAWQMRAPGSDISGLLSRSLVGSVPEVYPTGSGYIVSSPGSTGLLLGTGGISTILHAVPTQLLTPRYVVLPTPHWLRAVMPRTGGFWKLREPSWGSRVILSPGAQVDDSGTLWVFSTSNVSRTARVSWRDSSGWHSYYIKDPRAPYSYLLLNAMWNRPDGFTQVISTAILLEPRDRPGVAAITTDSGASWHTYPAAAFPFQPGSLKGLAVDGGGTLYVADARGRLWRSTDTTWTHFTRMSIGTKVVGLQPAGGSVLAQVASSTARLKVEWLSGGATQGTVTIR